MEVYREIIKKDLRLPKNGNPIFNDFIKGFLKKKVNERICSYEIIIKHEFYKDFNWDDLLDFKLIPPYIPSLIPLKRFEDYDLKYIEFLENEKNYRKNNNKDNFDKDKDKNNNFDPNWADVF